ncbi:MAG: flagellar export protein FliJ [Selenomonadaceae bacterium]|nr:flagellar export protein FliJ [Selenomonadaceae bacterium]
MKKFRFKLETLLKVTRMNKEQAQVALALATREVEEARAQLSLYLQEMAQGHKDYAELTGAGKTISLGRLMTFNSFFNWKREQIESQQRVIMEKQAVRQKKMQELVAVMNKLKSIEQLKEKRLQQYMAEALQEEQKQLDEIGGQLYFRNQG